MARNVITLRMSADELGVLDGFARRQGLTRSAALRELVRIGLDGEGERVVVEGLPPPTLQGAQLLLLAHAWRGSAAAALALKRSLRHTGMPLDEAPADPWAPFGEPAPVDELAKRRHPPDAR